MVDVVVENDGKSHNIASSKNSKHESTDSFKEMKGPFLAVCPNSQICLDLCPYRSFSIHSLPGLTGYFAHSLS
jgi:hypothetical protein